MKRRDHSLPLFDFINGRGSASTASIACSAPVHLKANVVLQDACVASGIAALPSNLSSDAGADSFESRMRDYAKAEIICGVDEAGRGPLAGPVFAAAVILDPNRPVHGLRDSKKLTEARRDALAVQIRDRALAWSVAQCSEAEIDALNILQATMLAMRRAIEGLSMPPTLALIDGNRCPVCPVRSEAIIKGDDKVPAISAASILAKTARDAALVVLHQRYPHYAFDQHKGYPTALHLERLRTHGVSPVHRKSYAPVRALLGAAHGQEER